MTNLSMKKSKKSERLNCSVKDEKIVSIGRTLDIQSFETFLIEHLLIFYFYR